MAKGRKEARRGRRPKALTEDHRRQIVELLKKQRTMGLPRLRRLIPGLSKNAAATYIRRVKSLLVSLPELISLRIA